MPPNHNSPTLYGHPKGLFVLFFTEMWERFSYYGMRALLVLYMTQHLLTRDENDDSVLGLSPLRETLESFFGTLTPHALASHIYGLYTGLVYFTPIFGGMLADRFLGARKTVISGAILMAIGHFLMASEAFFLLALLLLIVGNGCFKPNISIQVGNLYPSGDPRRDSAFSLFYMGINLGALFSPLVCGTLGQVYGWHYGFAAAGVGMTIGLITFIGGQRYLAVERDVPNLPTRENRQPLTVKDWQAIFALSGLAVVNIMFWAVYEQQGNSLQLFADRRVDWQVLGWRIPSTWFQAFNPILILCLVPTINYFSRRSAAYLKPWSGLGKMALGACLLGLSFIALRVAIANVNDAETINLAWLLLCTLVYTLGELYLSPVGLSLVARIAPVKLGGMMMGIWFLSSFFGNYLSGYIGSYYEKMPNDSFFMLLASLGIGTGIAIMAFQPLLAKAINVR